MKFMCESPACIFLHPSYDQCFTPHAETDRVVFSVWKYAQRSQISESQLKEADTCCSAELGEKFGSFGDYVFSSWKQRKSMKSDWKHPAREINIHSRTHKLGFFRLDYACWTLTFQTDASPPPQACTETQWPGSTEQVSLHPCTNVPDEILSIWEGNLQPETGWLQTRGAADHSDGWGRWFVECL